MTLYAFLALSISYVTHILELSKMLHGRLATECYALYKREYKHSLVKNVEGFQELTSGVIAQLLNL
jgi:hypothetical protein